MSAANILNRQVLVLNKSWVAFAVWSMKDAITQLYKIDRKTGQPKAKIVKYTLDDTGTYTWDDWAKLMPADGEAALKSGRPDIGSASAKFKIPEIIVLSDYNGFWKPRTTFSRRMIYKLYNKQCQYCAKFFGTQELNIDHVIPTSRGGKTRWDNCVLTCVKCNSKKANRTPEEAGMKLICGKPKKPSMKLFDFGEIKCESWKAFLDAAYWNVDIGD